MNRVVIQEGYSLPFAGTRRRRHHKRRRHGGKRRSMGAFKAQQNVMKDCARKWNGKGSYKAHMKRCLAK